VLIKLFDYKGIEARQIIGCGQFAINTEKKRCVVFLGGENMTIENYYDYELSNDCLSIYIFKSADEYRARKQI
jgi:hypothetical protein